MKINRSKLSLILVFVLILSNMTVFGMNTPNSSVEPFWIGEPEIEESQGKKIEVYGKLQIPKSYKGNTKIKLEINGFNVNPDKDGSFTKSIFKETFIEIRVFTGKSEIESLSRNILYIEDKYNIEEVERLINEIPPIYELTLKDKGIVEAARAAYNNLTVEEKSFINNLNLLRMAETRILELEDEARKVILTLEGEGLTSIPGAGKIYKGTEITVSVNTPVGKAIDIFNVNGKDKKYELTNNKYSFIIMEDTTIAVTYKEVEKGNVHISLFKDTASSKIDFVNISNFYIRNKATGEVFRDGSSPWNGKNRFEMKDVPVGEYTIHFGLLDGMYISEIQLGESYKETIYNAETNPFVIVVGKTNYVKIILKTEFLLKEIKPLDDLIVPVDISIEEFKEALPKQATIVDSVGIEHQVDLKWDIRPFVFDGWKKPGEYTLWSEFFSLPLNVSNSVPATRLESKLKVIFN